MSETFHACCIGNETVVKYLVDHGAEINIVNNLGETPLLYACSNDTGNLNLVKYLIEHGTDINVADNDGKSSLLI